MTGRFALILLVGLGGWVMPWTADAAPSPASVLESSFEHLGSGELQDACDDWMELLGAPWPYSAVALHQMEIWHEACSISAGVGRVCGKMTNVPGGPVTQARGRKLARTIWQKWGEGLGEPLPPGVLPPSAATSVPLSAQRMWPTAMPNVLALLGVPVAAPEDGLVRLLPAESTIRRSEWMIQVGQAGVAVFMIPVPGPASVWLDGVGLGVRTQTRPSSAQTPWTVSAVLNPGCHHLVALDSPGVGARPLRLMAFLPEENSVVERCETVSNWEEISGPGSCKAGGWICLLAELAEARLDEPLSKRLYDRLVADASPAVVLTWLRTETSHAPSDPRILGMLESATKGFYCMVDLAWVRYHIMDGTEAAAKGILAGLDGRCLETAEARLAQIELAVSEGFYKLGRRLASQAHGQFPKDCRVTLEWARGLADDGVDFFTQPSGVRCTNVEEEIRRDTNQWGVDPGAVLPEDFVLPETAPAWLQRKLVLQWLGTTATTAVKRVSLEAPQLFHSVLALLLTQEPRTAMEAAEATRRNSELWSWERSVAGRISEWSQAVELTEDPFQVIQRYQASQFAPESPQVMVLEETVVLVGGCGWMSSVETAILHLTSPTAVEAIGEISLESGRERLLAGVVKPDGTWIPAAPSQVGNSDSLSFKTLAPGDFLVMRTIREVPPEFTAGACHLPGVYTFGNRSMPIFQARMVVRLDDVQHWEWEVSSQVGVRELSPGTVEFRMDQIPPIPLEPAASHPLDGLETVQLRSRCLTWPLLRDAMADRLLAHCNQTAPESLVRPSNDPLGLVREVAASITDDGSSWDARDVSDIWEKRSGSLGLATWCTLLAAGFDAWPVVVNAAGLPDVNWGSPSWSAFRGIAIMLGHQGHKYWLFPSADGVDAQTLPPEWLGRKGLLLRPLDARLTVEVPKQASGERQEARLEVTLEEDGQIRGTLLLSATGLAGVNMLARVQDALPEEKEANVAAYLRHFLATAVVRKQAIEREDGQTTLRLEFTMDRPQSALLRIGMPPKPLLEWTALAGRTQPLAFPGLVPTKLEIKVRTKGDEPLRTDLQTERIVSPFGELSLEVEADEDQVFIRKEVVAGPTRVLPDAYRGFAEFIGRLQQRSVVEVKLK